MALPVASVQLYTLAEQFSADMNGSLERLAEIGLKNVEAFDFVRRPDEIRAALDAAGLASPTGHAPLLSDTLWTPDGSIPTPEPQVVFEAAAKVGMSTVIDPMVPTERWLTEDGVKDIADRINALAEIAAQFGLTVGYHNHAQEFLASFDGQTAYERFVALTEDRVAIELDLFWALVGGQDPAALTASLGDRLIAAARQGRRRARQQPVRAGRRGLLARRASISATPATATCRWWSPCRPPPRCSTPSSSTTTPPVTSSPTSPPRTPS